MSIFGSSVVTSEFQTFINQCIRCSLKVSYVYSCIWCVSSGCIQLSQECIACGCTSFINSRTNVVDNHVTTSCIAITIHEGCDYITFIYIITSCTIKICCESTIWTFNNFCTISFSVNCWSYSIYCISCTTCCTVRCGCNSYVVASFYNSTKFSNFFLTFICDVRKIIFSNAFNNCFFISNSVIITIKVCHSYIAITIDSIFMASSCRCNVTFSSFYSM